MAADMFLKITDVKGESQDAEHKDEIEILSFSWGATNQGTGSVGTGSGAGKVSMSDFSFVMSTNTAAPALFIGCAKGTHFTEAKLTCRKAGDKPQKYLEVTMNEVLVSSYQTGGSSGGDVPMDSVSLNFAKVTMEYFAQDAKGITKSAGKKSWDTKKNQAA